MSVRTALLAIDAQFDFCNPDGALFVPGADQDILRLVALLDRMGNRVHDIVVTLDTHQVLDISHPGFWRNGKGEMPLPFTAISFEMVKNGVWQPIWEEEWVLSYLETLERQGQFEHFIWPEHCLIGSAGNALEPVLEAALSDRARTTGRNHLTVIKGLNPFTEHFGIFEAQVPMGGDPDTQLNRQLIDYLSEYDRILVAGEARSHCVGTSIRQVLKHAPGLIPNMVLLTDCMSDITGMGHLAAPIYREAEEKGMQFALSTEIQ